MANTTNFGWETPDDTDLVKDGALAMRTLGNAIDTSLVDLKGGTTGQILAKNTNTDMDFVWITNDQGDITAVTAGTGISGGGTTGAVTITNSMATAIDAKGDLIVGTGADTFSRLAVGTNGHYLVADSGETTGLKWAAPSASSLVGCSLTDSGTQSIATATFTAITWNTEDWDTDSFHSTVTNTSRITIPVGKAGKYLVTSGGQWDDNTAGGGDNRTTRLYKNGSLLKQLSSRTPTEGYPVAYGSIMVSLAEGDYIEMYVYQTSGGSRTFTKSSTVGQFAVFYLGA